jgi:thiosulfate/3-mercaptopyruvate sulfurtransferase
MPFLLAPFRFLRQAALVAVAAVVFAAPAASEPLVSVPWLNDRLGDPAVVVLDVRSAIDGGGAEAYSKAHIPGSVHSDYDKAGWRVARGGVQLMLPTVPELEKLIGELGIDEDNHVVVVPAGVHVSDFGAAARVYWTLKLVGHTKVSILDGGFAAWQAAGLPVEAGAKRPSPKIFTATLDKSLLADAREVEAASRTGSQTLVDARPASFFVGKEKSPFVATYGHIPGARSYDSAVFYDAATNRLKPKADIAATLAALPAGPAISYCNTGHWAATDWFVLSEVLGRKDVKLYPGSMAEWTADASRPVESSRTKWDDLKKVLGRGS